MEYFNFVVIASVVNWIGEGIQVREDQKIQGGENVTDMARFPFIGYYESFNDEDFTTCTATLIDPFSAITAGHCVLVNTSVKPYRLLPLTEYKPFVVFGSANHSQPFPFFHIFSYYQRRNITKLFIHPQARYDGRYPFEIQFDIGAVKWKKKVDFNEKTQLIPLIPEEMNPRKVFLEIIQKRELCEIAGWGALESIWSDSDIDLPVPEMLQVLTFRVITKDTCCSSYFKRNPEQCMRRLGMPVSGLLCFEREKINTSIALGDSGSPLYCPYKGKKYVIGIHVGGIGTHDPPPPPGINKNGTVEIFNPAFFVIDAAMRPYIKTIREATNAFSHSPKHSIGVLCPIISTIFTQGIFAMTDE